MPSLHLAYTGMDGLHKQPSSRCLSHPDRERTLKGLKMENTGSSEMLTTYRTAWHHSPEYRNLLHCKMRPVFRSFLSLEVRGCPIHEENTSVNELNISPNAKGSPFVSTRMG